MDESNYIYGTQPRELNQSKEVKMRLGVGHLLRLHSLKLLSGQNISDTVDKALAAYFAKLDGDKQVRRAAQAPQRSQEDVIVEPAI